MKWMLTRQYILRHLPRCSIEKANYFARNVWFKTGKCTFLRLELRLKDINNKQCVKHHYGRDERNLRLRFSSERNPGAHMFVMKNEVILNLIIFAVRTDPAFKRPIMACFKDVSNGLFAIERNWRESWRIVGKETSAGMRGLICVYFVCVRVSFFFNLSVWFNNVITVLYVPWIDELGA